MKDYLDPPVRPCCLILVSQILQTGRMEHLACKYKLDGSQCHNNPEQDHGEGKDLDLVSNFSSENLSEGRTMVDTLKKSLSRFSARAPVQVATTPKGNVNPHQPMLKGKLCIVAMLIKANESHTRAKPHIMMAKNTPST